MWLLGIVSTSLGILIGGTIAWLFKGLDKKIDTVYAICAGLILGLISVEILPEALSFGNWSITIIGLIVGIITFELLHYVLHHTERSEIASMETFHIRTGLLLIVSLSIHHLPMGIILGTSDEHHFSMTFLQILLLHSIPEGIILFTPFMLSGINVFVMLFISLIVSIPVGVGTVIGGLLKFEHQLLSASFVSFTVGFLLMVTISEILYPALVKSSKIKVLIVTLIGLGIMIFYSKLIT